MTQPPDDAALVLRLGSPGWDNFGNFVPPEIKPADHNAAITGYSYLVMALQRQLAEAATALKAKDRRIAEVADLLIAVLEADPGPKADAAYRAAREWWTAYDRAALEPSDKGVGA